MANGIGILDFRRLLSNRKYSLYVVGNFCSTLGVWIQRVAIGWLAWELTKSPAWLGVIMFAEAGPTIVLGFVAGAMLDRYNQMFVLRLTQGLIITYSGLLAFLTFSQMLNIWLLLALVLFRGAVFAINRPARQTIVYALVGRELLANAVALNATVFNSSKFIGPAIGGVLLVAFGINGALLAALVLQLVFTALLALIGRIENIAKKRERESIIKEIAEGLRYVASHDGIRLQFAVLLAVSLFA